MIAAIVAAYANAQQIAVVGPNGATTSLFTDLNLAIQKADAGSTIYLSGGGFQVNDTTKITKKLTIIGVGHRPDNKNADGNTNVSGNFWFEGGSDGSAVLGLYLSGDVNIGTSESAVNNFLLRYCNGNSVQVKNSNCQDIRINQNYLRNPSSGGNAPIQFTNNIMHSAISINGGKLISNLIRYFFDYGFYEYGLQSVQIINNIFRERGGASYASGNNVVANNMCDVALGDNCIVPDNWDDVFEGPDNGVNPTSNFRLKNGAWKTGATNGGEIGIYGGSGFSETALPPMPRITNKVIAKQTDANGMLKVQITISAE